MQLEIARFQSTSMLRISQTKFMFKLYCFNRLYRQDKTVIYFSAKTENQYQIIGLHTLLEITRVPKKFHYPTRNFSSNE